jgi:L-seryl-tRNA(Ser) seleniumtransferase
MERNEQLRALPKVSDLLERPDVAELVAAEPRALVTEALREAVEARRAAVLAGDDPGVSADEVVAHARVLLAELARPSLRRVVNAGGIVVHTNLGRSALALDAVAAVVEVAAGYSTLEYDAVTGERGSRHVHIEGLLCRLTGAEAAMAVNNNAAAVLLGLAGLAAGGEAIVSRGQLVEIGGSFRIPDIMSQSGARMVEVGATNKTHLSDYEGAITPDTALLLKVHSSNFRLVGFTAEVSLAELVELGASRGVPVFEDQGSGVLVDLTPWGLPGEPTIGSAVAAGADLVSASGDKLLGGPQAGILVGKGPVIAKLKKHPLARALRLDKMTLAALEATLRLYLDPERAVREVPTLAMLVASPEQMRVRAEALAARIRDAAGAGAVVDVVADVSRAGGGALPMADIPTFVVAVSPKALGPVELESGLRAWEPPVVTRIHDDRVHLDPRTLSADDEDVVVEALARLLRRA